MEENTQASENNSADNLNTAESNTNASLLSSVVVETKNTQPSSEDYSYIPEKFLEEGKPNFEKLAKSYTALEQKLGGKVPVNDVAEYDFQFQNPEQWDAEGLEQFKSFALEKGFSKEQFSDALSLYEQNVSSILDSFTNTPEKAATVLKQEWGKDFEKNLGLASKAVNAFAPAGFDIDSIGNDPNVLKLLSAIGSQLQEDTLPNSSLSNSVSKYSKLEIEELMSSKDYYTNKEKQKIVSGWYEANYK